MDIPRQLPCAPYSTFTASWQKSKLREEKARARCGGGRTQSLRVLAVRQWAVRVAVWTECFPYRSNYRCQRWLETTFPLLSTATLSGRTIFHFPAYSSCYTNDLAPLWGGALFLQEQSSMANCSVRFRHVWLKNMFCVSVPYRSQTSLGRATLLSLVSLAPSSRPFTATLAMLEAGYIQVTIARPGKLFY